MKHKIFTYTGKNYINADYTETYTRVSRWIKINYTIPRRDEDESKPFFRHDGKRCFLDDFLRTGSPWSAGITSEITAADGEAVNLAGYEADVYYKPLFVEIDEGGEAVRLYRYEGSNTQY